MIVTIDDLRTAARRRLPRALFDYIDGGAEDEVTLRANQRDFDRYRFRPRALEDVSRRNQSTTVLGIPVTSPLILAPTGFTGMFWLRGEAVAARAAAGGVIYTASTMSSARWRRSRRWRPAPSGTSSTCGGTAGSSRC
jgi:isopentenyl diphosphate isomerase/L-lactate dehydrogenase-like FMN-dependent dehydrogenase